MASKGFRVAACILVASAACDVAQAQSSVTLYGIVDTGIEYVSHANSAGDKVFRVPLNTGGLPSRWGLQGEEDLGGGTRAEFVLESGFNMGNGALGQGGRLFGRLAWVGINSDYGLLSFGRQYSMTYWALANVEPFYADIYGPGSLDAYLPNARSDGTVAYKGSFGDFTIGATYSFGRDSAGTGNTPAEGTCAGSVPGRPTECRQWSALVKYANAFMGVSTAYDEQRGGAAAAASFFNGVPAFPITSSADKDARTHLNAYFKAGADGALKFNAGWIGRRVTTDSPALPGISSNLYYVGAAYQATPALLLDSEAYRIIDKNQDTRATKAVARATYALSKHTSVYVQGAYLFNSRHAAYAISAGGPATPALGQGQTAAMIGVRHLL